MEEKNVLPDNLSEQLANILSLEQSILDTFYAGENPMMDRKQTRLFGFPFGNSFHNSCTARFEFVDLFLENYSTVNSHIDYKCQNKSSYTYKKSYPYLIIHKSDKCLYITNFIM